MAMEDHPKELPHGSSAFARVMADIQMPPIVEVSKVDDADGRSSSRRSSAAGNHHEEGKIIHGLHHCYKVEGGQCLTSYRCHHDHHRLSSGHLEEIAPGAGPPSPNMRRRMSVASSNPGMLHPDDSFRQRSSSDAASRRRGSMPVNHYTPGQDSPQRRGSVDQRTQESEGTPNPLPNRQRRGSNVVLHSEQLHYVYDQYLKK